METRFPTFITRALAQGPRAVFTVPLRHENHQMGALDLYRDSPGGLSDTDLATCQTLADVAAAYLINARAREELQESSERSRMLALHDGLTGLPNRTLMLERLEHAFARDDLKRVLRDADTGVDMHGQDPFTCRCRRHRSRKLYAVCRRPRLLRPAVCGPGAPCAVLAWWLWVGITPPV